MAAKPKSAPKPKSAKQVATAYFEAIANRDVEAMMELWEPGGYGHMYGAESLRAPDGYRQWFGNFFRAIPEMRFEVIDMVAYGEKAAVRWRMSGTFDGPTRLEGFAPNGGTVELEGLDLLTIRDGLIRENRAYTNGLELARQIGAMPPPGSFGEKLMIGLVNARTAAVAAIRRMLERG